MAEFKDSSLWLKLGFVFSTMAMIFWCVASLKMIVKEDSVEACYVIAFFGILVGLILLICLIFVDETQGNKPALICAVIFLLVGAVMMIIAVGIWGGKKECQGNFCVSYDPDPYGSLCAITGGVLAFIAGLFGVFELVGFKSGTK